MIRRSDESTIPPLAVGAADAAAMMGVSLRNWWRWHAAGRTPPSFKVAGDAGSGRWPTCGLGPTACGVG
ncbi:MAG: hypothetical protein V3T70_08010 [Phycisphaerae bacterium]